MENNLKHKKERKERKYFKVPKSMEKKVWKRI